MKTYARNILGMVLVALVVALAPAMVRAEVVRVAIANKQDVLNGKAFGAVGAYEKLVGKIYFAVDPKNPHNKIIADLDKAPKNAQGKVEFSADIFILRPKDASKGNGVVFLDIPNRGGKGLLSTFNRAKGSADPTTAEEFGDGLLMNKGYTLVSVGWEFDNPKRPGLVLLDAPVATDNGKPITGWVTPGPWFIPPKQSDSFNYVSQDFAPVYPPLDPKNPAYRLTERPALVSAPTLVPRADWQFGRMEDGKLTFDPYWVTMKGGFKPGWVYQVTYESSNPAVAGVGFAALRDFASAVKNDPNAIVHGKYVYTFGSSQVGRWQRQFVYEGFTIDEAGKKAVDALFIQTSGGTSLGSFNERWAQPNELGSYTQTKFPIRYETTTDPVTGKRDGLGARIPAGMEPKIFYVDTESEMYDRGRNATLRTISMDGREDLPDSPNVRVFLLTGAKHGSGTWPPADAQSQQLRVDPLDYRWAQRALLASLDKWAREGVAPVASQAPKLSDHTAVALADMKFPDVAGVRWPSRVPGGMRDDLPAGPTAVLPFLVPQVDKDGNVISGLRLPEQSVPLGTYGGWAFRSEAQGQPETMVSMAGSYIPFAKTRAERERNHDPRLSIEERYGSREDYLRRVQDAANKLAQGHYILEEDVAPIVEAAGQHWDWTMSSLTTQAAK
jgi:hypothetical protein